MPNILDRPMKKTENITISKESAFAVFTAWRARIEVNSTINKGIQINSYYKSEQVSIGINDYYLASVSYRKRAFPIWLVLHFIFAFIGAISIFYTNNIELLIFCVVISLIFLFIYYYTKMARLSFRLADEQDYDILLESGEVNDSNLMQLFIQKVLMNALKVEGFVSDVKPNEKPIKQINNAVQPPNLVQPVIPANAPVRLQQATPQITPNQTLPAQPLPSPPLPVQPLQPPPLPQQRPQQK